MRIEHVTAKMLTLKKKTLSVAESCTGGLLSHTLTNIPGSSRFFHLGIVAYDNEAKSRLLKIPAKIMAIEGPVSASVAKRMAENVRRILKTSLGVGITGIAGPKGNTQDTPVGLVHIAASDETHTLCQTFHFTGTRAAIKKKSVAASLRMLQILLK